MMNTMTSDPQIAALREEIGRLEVILQAGDESVLDEISKAFDSIRAREQQLLREALGDTARAKQGAADALAATAARLRTCRATEDELADLMEQTATGIDEILDMLREQVDKLQGYGGRRLANGQALGLEPRRCELLRGRRALDQAILSALSEMLPGVVARQPRELRGKLAPKVEGLRGLVKGLPS